MTDDTPAARGTPEGTKSTYMVERYLPNVTRDAMAPVARLAREVGAAMSGGEGSVRHVRSVIAPTDEWCCSLFVADSAAAVLEAHRRAGILVDRIVEIVTMEDQP